MMKKITFNVDGRELEAFELSNEQLVKLIKEKKDKILLSDSTDITPSEIKSLEKEIEVLNKRVLDRFYVKCCKHNEAETYDDVFARQFSDYVNSSLHNAKEAAENMACDHRYLQNEMFKVCMAYIKKLSENYEKDFFDPRNEYAVKTSNEIINHLKDIDYFF